MIKNEGKTNMRYLKVFATILAVIFSAACSGNLPISETVKIEQGLIEGSSQEGLMVFKGIPFAKPPVDDLAGVQTFK